MENVLGKKYAVNKKRTYFLVFNALLCLKSNIPYTSLHLVLKNVRP